jgi:hypothetical protein
LSRNHISAISGAIPSGDDWAMKDITTASSKDNISQSHFQRIWARQNRLTKMTSKAVWACQQNVKAYGFRKQKNLESNVKEKILNKNNLIIIL